MKLKARGVNTSAPEVTHISAFGIWVLLDDREFMLGYDDFPWFKDATLSEIHNVKRVSGSHLYWPELDVDLDSGRMESPGNFPLISKVKSR